MREQPQGLRAAVRDEQRWWQRDIRRSGSPSGSATRFRGCPVPRLPRAPRRGSPRVACNNPSGVATPNARHEKPRGNRRSGICGSCRRTPFRAEWRSRVTSARTNPAGFVSRIGCLRGVLHNSHPEARRISLPHVEVVIQRVIGAWLAGVSRPAIRAAIATVDRRRIAAKLALTRPKILGVRPGVFSENPHHDHPATRSDSPLRALSAPSNSSLAKVSGSSAYH